VDVFGKGWRMGWGLAPFCLAPVPVKEQDAVFHPPRTTEGPHWGMGRGLSRLDCLRQAQATSLSRGARRSPFRSATVPLCRGTGTGVAGASPTGAVRRDRTRKITDRGREYFWIEVNCQLGATNDAYTRNFCFLS
jgi:hypothetical protein